jgi:hypothetical protein
LTKALLLLACLAGCSNWRARDTVLETTLIGLTVVDWHQTKDITARCSEINPIIGECGQRMNMHVYFVSVIALEMIVGRLLSPSWRSVLHGAWIGAEGATVWDNTQP